MAWTVDIQGPNGGANQQTDVPFRALSITWTADGPGAAQIDLTEAMVDDWWTPGLHRVVIKESGVAKFAGYINKLTRSGDPDSYKAGFTAYANGLGWILDLRLVRHAYVIVGTKAEIVESLLDEAQLQFNGDMGFQMGTITGAAGIDHTRSYCFGVVIGDAIREIGATGTGFDWEIDASGDLNIWNGGRGVSTAETLQESETMDWAVDLDTSDMVTTVSAIGEPANPFGPIHDMVRSGLATTYGRREVAMDVPSDDRDELIDAATAELKAKGGASFEVTASWIEGRGPWAFEGVWLQDEVSVVLPDYFGGTQDMRCTDITLTLEPTPESIWFIEQRFQALVTDITEGDPDFDESS